MSGSPQVFGFILLPGFALMSYASAVEPLRAANLLAGRELYRWKAFSAKGTAVVSSSGAIVPGEALPQAKGDLDTLFVAAGGDPADWNAPAVHAALRRLARQDVRIGGISGGPYVLAAAGLLDGYRFTVHWEHAPALIEAFPDLRPEAARYIVDRNRLTCGGGVAPLDMMHAIVADRMGEAFARQVSDWFLHTHVDMPSAPQRASLAERYGTRHPLLVSVLTLMETNIAAPLDRATMATLAGLSPRHLDRLFASHLGTSFGRHYRRMRLEQARRLLRQSLLSVTEIAVATGFANGAHFARCYGRQFGISPSQERAIRARS